MSSRFISWLFNLVVPPRRTERIVAALTLGDLERLRTAQGLPYHDKEVQALVWELKYYGSSRAAALAGALLSEELMGLAAEELGRPLLLPVPMHYSRLHERGHNQTELLCEAALRALEDFSAFDYIPHALKRIRMTPEQQKLDRIKRLKNVAGSMQAVHPELVEGRVCVVVDDVTTTGATLREAQRALKAAGALRVHCIALAYS